jgi:hypothetical protein
LQKLPACRWPFYRVGEYSIYFYGAKQLVDLSLLKLRWLSADCAVVATIHFPQITHDKLLVSVFGGFFWEAE